MLSGKILSSSLWRKRQRRSFRSLGKILFTVRLILCIRRSEALEILRSSVLVPEATRKLPGFCFPFLCLVLLKSGGGSGQEVWLRAPTEIAAVYLHKRIRTTADTRPLQGRTTTAPNARKLCPSRVCVTLILRCMYSSREGEKALSSSTHAYNSPPYTRAYLRYTYAGHVSCKSFFAWASPCWPLSHSVDVPALLLVLLDSFLSH